MMFRMCLLPLGPHGTISIVYNDSCVMWINKYNRDDLYSVLRNSVLCDNDEHIIVGVDEV